MTTDEFSATLSMTDDGVGAFRPRPTPAIVFHQAEPEAAERAATRMQPQRISDIGLALPAVAWEGIPSTYVVCTGDGSIPPDYQRLSASSAGYGEDRSSLGPCPLPVASRRTRPHLGGHERRGRQRLSVDCTTPGSPHRTAAPRAADPANMWFSCLIRGSRRGLGVGVGVIRGRASRVRRGVRSRGSRTRRG